MIPQIPWRKFLSITTNCDEFIESDRKIVLIVVVGVLDHRSSLNVIANLLIYSDEFKSDALYTEKF